MTTKADFKEIFYPESRFGGFSDVDGTILFYTRVNALLKPDSVVLDIGCGPGPSPKADQTSTRLREFKGRCARYIGIDVDPKAAGNSRLDEFRMIEGDRWPVDDASVDLAVSDFVLEHVADPESYFAEARRVIRPGGCFCLRVPNAWSYFGVVSRLVPNRYHGRVKKAVGNTAGESAYYTYYRCNTVGKVCRALRNSGFSDHCVYGQVSEPAYFNFSKTAYRLACWAHRILPRRLSPCLFVFARRDGA